MNYFSVNLKFLRKSKNLTQTEFANKIGVNRSIIGSYEEGRAEPKLLTLQNISHFFKVKIDDLLERDLSQRNTQEEKDIAGNQLRILPIVVNDEQTESISMVPVKAAAGYLNGYADAEYIEDLKRFHMPFSELGEGSFRAFQIEGDSMKPIPSGSYIVAQYVENWNWINDGETYVVISKEDGVVYKRLENKLESEKKLVLHSDNAAYESYEVLANNLCEVWKAKAFLSFDLSDKRNGEMNSIDNLTEVVLQLKKEVDNLKDKN